MLEELGVEYDAWMINIMNQEILSVTTVIITAGLSSHIILRDEYKLDLSFSSVPPLLGVETSLMYEVGQSFIRDSNSDPVKKYKFIYIFYRDRLHPLYFIIPREAFH